MHTIKAINKNSVYTVLFPCKVRWQYDCIANLDQVSTHFV